MLDGDRLVGGVLVGDAGAARQLSELLRSGDGRPVEPARRRRGTAAAPLAEDPAATICSCNEVTVGEVQTAIRRDGLTTVAQVGGAHARDDRLRRLRGRRAAAARRRGGEARAVLLVRAAAPGFTSQPYRDALALLVECGHMRILLTTRGSSGSS